MEALLEAVFYRQSCPTSEQLLDYHLGLLASAIDTQLRAHIELCPHCTSDLRSLMQIGLEAQPAPSQAAQRSSLLRRLQQLIPNLALLPGVLQQPMALPALRGAESDILRIFTAGDYRLSLSIQRTPASPTITLEGNLLDPGDPSQSPVGKVHLLQAVSNELLATQALDDFGLFSFSALPPNTYILAIELARQTILLPEITLA